MKKDNNMKNCGTCGRFFKATKRRKTFCSFHCRVEWSLKKMHSQESRKKISASLIERYKDPKNHPRYRTGIATKENLKKYKIMKYREWRASKMAAIGSHSYIEFEELKQKYHNICLCCKRQEPFIVLTEDHIVPLSLGGTDDIGNIQPLCQSCNSRKHVKSTDFRTSVEEVLPSLLV